MLPALAGLQRKLSFIQRLLFRAEFNNNIFQRRNGVNAELQLLRLTNQLQRQLRIGILHHPQLAIGKEVLHKHLLFIRRKPGKVRLVIGVDAGHQLDIGAIFVGQIAVPRLAKVAIAPAPLFFARRDVMVGNMQQPTALVVVISADKVVVRFLRHIRGGYRNVFITGDIDARRIVHFVVGAGGDGKSGNIALAVIEYGGDVGWKHALVSIAAFDRRVGPPQEMTRRCVTIKNLTGDFNQRAVRIESKPGHDL